MHAFRSSSGSSLSTSYDTCGRLHTILLCSLSQMWANGSNKLLFLEEEHAAEQTVRLRGKEIDVSMSEDKVGGLGL